jgi:hypothetical protein
MKTVESGIAVFLDKDNNPISYDDFVAKVNAALGALNGLHGPVSTTARASSNGAEGPHVNAQADDARGPDSDYQ